MAFSLADEEYLAFCQDLQKKGIEVAFHGVSSGDNKREDVVEGLEKFRKVFGVDPSAISFHKHNAENLYWGESFSGNSFRRRVVRWIVPTHTEEYKGHVEGSDYFCGDLLRNHIRFTRLFRTRSLDVLAKNPGMPFHLIRKPHVKFWFSASAQDLHVIRRINDKAIEKLARKDGCCILYAHMAEKFVTDDGEIHPEVKRAFEVISRRTDCWNPGVSELLDRLLAVKNIIISKQRHGIVLSNPTDIDIPMVQILCDADELFLASGEKLDRDNSGHFVLEMLPAGSSLVLYPTAQLASVGDPKGMRWNELLKMQVEEIKRIISFRRDYQSISQRTIPIDEICPTKEQGDG